jgi:NADPH2:quinone reductase
MKAVRVLEPGGPDQMKLVDVPAPSTGPGQALVKIAAIGVNYIDTYFRTGLYKSDLPIDIGMEAAGTVEAIGAGVTEVAVGDRVAYAMARGSYAEYASVPSRLLVKVPPAVSFQQAAAIPSVPATPPWFMPLPAARDWCWYRWRSSGARV